MSDSAQPADGRPLDAVVTHHLDGFRSGVARFNELLAERLGVPLYGLDGIAKPSCPLLSFKVSELRPRQRERVQEWTAGEGRVWEVFLHDWSDSPLEEALVRGARVVHCGNREIEAAVRPLAVEARASWTPGLITETRAIEPVEISVFSFGMAHKIRTEMFRRLKEMLDRTGSTYAVYVSAANHETASLRDSEAVFQEMHEIFPESLFFLGNLSDLAVLHYLADATFFAAFFRGGVRANNTSVASAMERGAVVLTNLDEYSPPEYEHMANLIDVQQCTELPTDPLVLRRIGTQAMELGRARDWARLVDELRR